MPKHIFQSSVDLVLCKQEGNELIDLPAVRIQNMTLDGITYLNSYIRRTYLTVQREAVADWSKREREDFMKMAMQHILGLAMTTVDGQKILFETPGGLLHFSWVYVKEHFATMEEWSEVLQSSPSAYNENIKRFNTAILDLAALTADELITPDDLPETRNTDWIDDMLAALIAKGISPDDAKSLTVEQAAKILGMEKEKASFNDPAEFKKHLTEALS
jgi:hypothetical protein